MNTQQMIDLASSFENYAIWLMQHGKEKFARKAYEMKNRLENEVVKQISTDGTFQVNTLAKKFDKI